MQYSNKTGDREGDKNKITHFEDDSPSIHWPQLRAAEVDDATVHVDAERRKIGR